jgi:hypothetical protein
MMINKSKNKNYIQSTTEVMQHELKMPKVFPFGEDRGAFLVLLNFQCVPQETCMCFLVGNKRGDEFFCCPQCYFIIFHSNSQKVPPSFHCVPQDVPNNTTFLSHMFCPKLNTKIKKCNPQLRVPTICTQFVPTKFPLCFQHVFNHTSFCPICFSQSCPFGSSLDAFLSALIDSNAKEQGVGDTLLGSQHFGGRGVCWSFEM